MNRFMTHDFNIEKTELVCFVPPGMGLITHTDRPNHGLALHTGGEKEYFFSDGKKITVKANDIIYLPKHSTYTVSANAHGGCYAINFLLSEAISYLPFAVKVKNHTGVTEHFRVADKIWESKQIGYKMKCKAELYNIIYTMQQEFFSEYYPKNKLDIIKPAIDYIHENYTTTHIDIDTLSKMCNISPEYFRKIFKSFYGVSPIKYINTMKITRAKELLSSQIYSVTDAAVRSGYTDISHFSREFKKIAGICPTEFIKGTLK